MLGAIVIAEPSSGEDWVPCLSEVPVLGNSVLTHSLDRIKRSGITPISVINHVSEGESVSRKGASLVGTRDPWGEAAQQLLAFEANGVENALIVRVGPYVECDLAVLAGWHRGRGETISRVYDKQGPLDCWIVDLRRFQERENLLGALCSTAAAEFETQGYVNRLNGPEEYRGLVADILTSRCQTRPNGAEVRKGVWIAEGAQIARGARVVAPAYVGRGVRVAEECLLTRATSVEQNSYIDFGTAVEDSSIMPNTYVGIGLDVSHSVVDGGELLNLNHGVKLKITDPVVMRRSTPRSHRTINSESDLGAVTLSGAG